MDSQTSSERKSGGGLLLIAAVVAALLAPAGFFMMAIAAAFDSGVAGVGSHLRGVLPIALPGVLAYLSARAAVAGKSHARDVLRLVIMTASGITTLGAFAFLQWDAYDTHRRWKEGPRLDMSTRVTFSPDIVLVEVARSPDGAEVHSARVRLTNPDEDMPMRIDASKAALSVKCGNEWTSWNWRESPGVVKLAPGEGREVTYVGGLYERKGTDPDGSREPEEACSASFSLTRTDPPSLPFEWSGWKSSDPLTLGNDAGTEAAGDAPAGPDVALDWCPRGCQQVPMEEWGEMERVEWLPLIEGKFLDVKPLLESEPWAKLDAAQVEQYTGSSTVHEGQPLLVRSIAASAQSKSIRAYHGELCTSVLGRHMATLDDAIVVFMADPPSSVRCESRMIRGRH